jgi:hypothetical protein
MTMLEPLKHPPFAPLWSGQTASRLGDATYHVALAWWVLERTGPAAATGAVMVFPFAPMLVFLLIGGVGVDGYCKVRVMLASDILRGVLVLGVAAFAATGRLDSAFLPGLMRAVRNADADVGGEW